MYLFLEFFEFISALISGLFSFHKKISQDLSNCDLLILPGLGAGSGFYTRLERRLSGVGYRPTILEVPAFTSEKEYLDYLNRSFSTVVHPLIVIAHNTAGLVVGALPDSSRRKIRTFVSLGTPYHGFKLFGQLTRDNWEPGSKELEIRLPSYLFIDQFQPLSPIDDYIFLPDSDNLQYGQGRDQWFDIPGNYNLVRRRENIRTLVEFIQTLSPPTNYPSKDSVEFVQTEISFGTSNIPKSSKVDSIASSASKKKSKVNKAKQAIKTKIAKKALPDKIVKKKVKLKKFKGKRDVR